MFKKHSYDIKVIEIIFQPPNQTSHINWSSNQTDECTQMSLQNKPSLISLPAFPPSQVISVFISKLQNSAVRMQGWGFLVRKFFICLLM